MNKKFMALAAAAMSAVLALSSCGFVKQPNEDGVISDAESNVYDETIVAEVNGQDMTLADFNYMYYNNAANIQQYFMYMGITDWESQPYDGDYEDYIGKTYGEIVRQATIDQMASLIVIQQKAKEYDILVDDDIVKSANQQKQDQIDQYFGGDEQEYKNYLDYCFISDYTVEKAMQRSAVADKLMERLSKEGEICYVSDSDVENSYVKASHVLILVDEDTSDEEALAKAKEVVAKLDAGEDMAKLIAEYGEDPGMTRQPYYVFTEGEMVTEFYEGALALGADEYTKEPVKTSYGYHVIYRYPLTPSDEGYEDVVSNMEDTRAQLESIRFNEAVQQWIETASTKVYDDVLDEHLAKQQEKLAAEQQAAMQEALTQYPDITANDEDDALPELEADAAE